MGHPKLHHDVALDAPVGPLPPVDADGDIVDDATVAHPLLDNPAAAGEVARGDSALGDDPPVDVDINGAGPGSGMSARSAGYQTLSSLMGASPCPVRVPTSG